MKTITELRQEIVDRSLQAFHEGLFSGTSGNMSCYLREEDLMLITPTSVRYDVMRAEDIVALRLDGTVVEGHLKPSSEWRMHTAVYENCPDVNAVFHTHSPYATAFAVNHQTIPAVLIEALVFLGGDIRCADYATPGTKEVGLNALPALEASIQRSSSSLLFPSSLVISERIFSFSLSSTDSSTIPLLSIRCWNKAYFSIVCRFSSEISMLRVPEALVCIVYIVVLF